MLLKKLLVFCCVFSCIVLEPTGAKVKYTGCGGNIEVNSLTVVYIPNYPHHYHACDCNWYIRSASKFYISLYIILLEDDYDIVRLWDRGYLLSGSHKRNFTGGYYSMRNVSVEYLRMNYVSDGHPGGTGFILAALPRSESDKCSHAMNITGPTIIQSPNYPSNYGSNLDCTWYLQSISGKSLRINVTEVNIEYSRSCKHDVLRLWATKDRTGVAPYQQFCGNLTFISMLRTQHLWINFRSDAQVQFKGFRIIVDIDESRNCDAARLFYQAAVVGNIRSMKYALDSGFDINCKYDSRPNLHAALSNRSKSIIKFMLNRGADVDITDDEGRTALFKAVTLNSLPLTLLLLERGADINAADDNGDTVLHVISRMGLLRLAQLVLARGIDDQLTNRLGFTATHITAENGHVKVCEMLINKTNLLSSKTLLGKTPLHLAAGKGNLEMVQLLVKRGAKLNDTDNVSATPLRYAVNANSYEIVRYLAVQGAEVEAQNKEKQIALFTGENLKPKTKTTITPDTV